jgi:hypothetical protein
MTATMNEAWSCICGNYNTGETCADPNCDKPRPATPPAPEVPMPRLEAWLDDQYESGALAKSCIVNALGLARADFAEHVAAKDKRIAELKAELDVKTECWQAQMDLAAQAGNARDVSDAALVVLWWRYAQLAARKM